MKALYLKKKSPDNQIITVTHEKYTSEKIAVNLFIIGFVSSSFQFLLLREMMNISGGYELISGTFLGSWLIGSAIGSAIAARSKLNNLKKINLIFSLSPVISILLLLLLSGFILNPGETPSFLVSMISTLFILLPFCLCSGFTFIKLLNIAREVNGFIPGKSFSLETAGGIAAGLLTAMLTSGKFNSYQLILLISTLYLAYTLNTFYFTDKRFLISSKLVFLILSAGIIIFNTDLLFRQILLRGIKVTGTTDTPYGNITQGNYMGESSLYYNQRLISYLGDIAESEENIHYAMLQCESPEKVIIVSGYLPSLITELSKYKLKKITFIERDPALTEKVSEITGPVLSELVIENNDAFRYIRNQAEKVDAIILLLPPPSTLLINRYYTTEFFKNVKDKLNSDGVFMCSPLPGDNYLNKESVNMYSSIFNSLGSVFNNVKPVIGNKLYLIASDKDISVSFCKLVELRTIKTTYVNSDYLDDENIIRKSNEVISLVDYDIKQNGSSFPIACFYYQSYNFSKDHSEKVFSVILIVLVFALPLVTIRKKSLFMYFSASSLAGFEIILLLTIQLVFGNMYQLTGLVIAVLMSGLAIGSGMRLTGLNKLSLSVKGLIIICFYILFGLFYDYLITMKAVLPLFGIFLVSTLIPAIFTGHLFRELTIKTENIVSTSFYSADLAGSAFGFILLSGFAIPVLGIQVSFYLLASLILAGILFGTISDK